MISSEGTRHGLLCSTSPKPSPTLPSGTLYTALSITHPRSYCHSASPLLFCVYLRSHSPSFTALPLISPLTSYNHHSPHHPSLLLPLFPVNISLFSLLLSPHLTSPSLPLLHPPPHWTHNPTSKKAYKLKSFTATFHLGSYFFLLVSVSRSVSHLTITVPLY